MEGENLKIHLSDQIIKISEKIDLLEPNFENLLSLREINTINIEFGLFKINMAVMVNIVNNMYSGLPGALKQNQRNSRNKNRLQIFKNTDEIIEYLGMEKTIESIKTKLISLDKRGPELEEVIDNIYGDKYKGLTQDFVNAYNKLDQLVLGDENNLDLEKISSTEIEFTDLITKKLHNINMNVNLPNLITTNLSFPQDRRKPPKLIPELKEIKSIVPNSIYSKNKSVYMAEIEKIVSDYKKIIVPKIKKLRELIESESEMLSILKNFDPDFPIFLPRLAELMNKDTEHTIELLKFTLTRNSSLGVFNDMAQVFKPSNEMGIEIDKLLAQFNNSENKT